MIREICDVCQNNNADAKYKIKKSRKGMYVRSTNLIKWVGDIWQPWEKIMICDECAEKLFSIKRLTYDAPDPKEIINIKQEIKHNE